MSDNLLAKLMYRSLHRGCKENDILLGNYATKNLHLLTSDQLLIYEKFLEETDTDIYNWVTNPQTTPQEYKIFVEGIVKDR